MCWPGSNHFLRIDPNRWWLIWWLLFHSMQCYFRSTTGIGPWPHIISFNIYIYKWHTVVTGIQNTLRFFANDCLIYRHISSPEDHCILQEYLNRLTMWTATWHKDDVSTHIIMQISNARHKRSFAYTYTMQRFSLHIASWSSLLLGCCPRP